MGKMSEEAYIRQIDREWNEAYPNADIAALDRVIADDWVCIDGSGTVIGKKDLLDRVGSSPNPLDSHKFDEIQLRLFGDTAIVTGRLSGAGTDETGAFEFSQRYTRVYLKRDGVWQAVATQVTPVKA
jgi:ketosteroid isomerase-like protein